jgi:hypothetical protein
VLCDVSGFAYQFEIYSGQENEAKNRLPSEPGLGGSGNTVVRLLRNASKNINHIVYFDNYYIGQSRVYCEKCGIALCFNQAKHCFKLFHNAL